VSNRGFIARGGWSGIGRLTVTHGLGGTGTGPYVPTPPEVVDEIVPGARAPRAVAGSRVAPKTLIYIPGAKKTRGGCD
jgi:hypothetical protein